GLFGADEAVVAEGEGGGGAAGEVERVDGVGRGFGRGGVWGFVVPTRHGFAGEGLGDGDFVNAVFGEGDADGVAEAVGEEGADADGGFDAAVFAGAGLGDAEVEGVVHGFALHAFDEEAVGLDHDLGVG